MEKIKKYSYYLFIYVLFAFWLIYFALFLFLGFYFLIDFINFYKEIPTLENLQVILKFIFLGIITVVIYCLAPQYFMKIKKKETAKIKDVILAAVYTILGFLSCWITIFIISLDLF